MKTIGLIGGMSWESTIPYYQLINQAVNRRLGKNHSAKIILYSFDFQVIEDLQYSGEWGTLEALILDAGTRLKTAGADFIIVCTNTMHKVVSGFSQAVGVPLLHIAEAVGEAVSKSGMRRVGLLGTVFTMEHDFYRSILEDHYRLEVRVPNQADRIIINDIIYQELVKGIINKHSEVEYLRIMDTMKAKGVEGIILGCTEIGLLIKRYDIPLFDSAIIHAKRAAEMCFE